MARGLYEMRIETEYKLQEMMNNAREQQMIEISKWHAYFKVRDKKLISHSQIRNTPPSQAIIKKQILIN